MPETKTLTTPDFEFHAQCLLNTLQGKMVGARLSLDELRTNLLNHITKELQLIWNARGAADIAKLDHELSTLMGSGAAGPYVKNLDRALRGLDR